MEPSPIVVTATGPVVGILQDDGVSSYRGIPYAAPPFGENRFRGPAPVTPWTEPRQATAFGPTSPQEEGASPGGLPEVPEPIIPGTEVLNLNVWTPDVAGSAPVLVWIHGGGFFAGCSANPWYDGSSFARQGIVVVSLNYRLAAEGFLELPGATPNRALRDWIAALTWVRENVAAFGGDPARVTVMGQSAGGVAVSSLLVSPAARGLFRQAVVASGITADGIATVAEAASVAARVGELTGRNPTRAGLLDLSPEELVRVGSELLRRPVEGDRPFRPPWAPVVDGELLVDDFRPAIEADAAGDIPVLVGTTQNEFAWLATRDGPDTPEARRAGQAELADALFRRPTDDFARLRARTAGAATYRYEFQWRSTAAPYIGAGHSLDIPFFFDTLDAPYVTPYTGPHPPQELARFMNHAFGSFVRTGDPGWAQYSQEETVMVFDTHPHTRRGVEL